MGKLIDGIQRVAPGVSTADYLYREIIVEGRTAMDVAAEHGVSREAVCKYLRRFNAKHRRYWAMRKPRRRAA